MDWDYRLTSPIVKLRVTLPVLPIIPPAYTPGISLTNITVALGAAFPERTKSVRFTSSIATPKKYFRNCTCGRTNGPMWVYDATVDIIAMEVFPLPPMSTRPVPKPDLPPQQQRTLLEIATPKPPKRRKRKKVKLGEAKVSDLDLVMMRVKSYNLALALLGEAPVSAIPKPIPVAEPVVDLGYNPRYYQPSIPTAPKPVPKVWAARIWGTVGEVPKGRAKLPPLTVLPLEGFKIPEGYSTKLGELASIYGQALVADRRSKKVKVKTKEQRIKNNYNWKVRGLEVTNLDGKINFQTLTTLDLL